ncbi:MAG: amino acid adenylation domain-containing protein [Terriglobales bacterium]
MRWLATFCLGRSRWSLKGRASIPGKGRPLALRTSPNCRQPYLLPQAVERAAARYPQTVALEAQGRCYTYAELERASRCWAQRLRAAGCGAGARVGVWMPKSAAAVAALLGVLRAEAVYVPLDSWSPPARIAALARDCGLSGLCADGERAEAAQGWERPPALFLSADAELGGSAGAETPAQLPSPTRTSDDLAYLLYTSGSTAAPKGVMHTHAHALNFIAWAGAEAGLGPGDRVASHAPFHFDLSIFDLWASLSRGAQVCLLDPVSARFGRAVAEWVVERGITVWYSVPSALVQLLPHAAALAGNRLRAVIFAGEVFPPGALATWRELLPGAEFHNWYGPTETNVCTYFRLPVGAPPQPLPLGSACPNFELTVRDEGEQPVAAGETGYLWARGPGILAGYWGDAERSAQVTRLWPAAGGEPAPRQRWYNTGDLAHQEGGLYYFHGRRDQVVKCRGYRVSLLEVEAALLACAGVVQAAVLALPEAAAAERLAAFVVPDAAGVSEAELRRRLGERLPAYMIPDAIEVATTLPLTSSGKVDRQRLQQKARPAAAAPPA